MYEYRAQLHPLALYPVCFIGYFGLCFGPLCCICCIPFKIIILVSGVQIPAPPPKKSNTYALNSQTEAGANAPRNAKRAPEDFSKGASCSDDVAGLIQPPARPLILRHELVPPLKPFCERRAQDDGFARVQHFWEAARGDFGIDLFPHDRGIRQRSALYRLSVRRCACGQGCCQYQRQEHSRL